MSRYKNNRKSQQIKKVGLNLSKDLAAEFSTMALRCKFNFSYLDSNQDGAADFNHFSKLELKSLILKIKDFSKESLEQWKLDGSYKNYGKFPSKTNFKHPSFVPEEVLWGRFRLQGKFRLAGFTVSTEIAKNHDDLDTNTFYVVFLDINHNFYLSKKKHT